MAVSLQHYLVLSALLFSLGIYGVLGRRNVIVLLMAVEILLNAVNIAFVALSRFVVPAVVTGQVFAVFVITVAAAEVTVGLAIVMAVYRRRSTVDIEQIDLMRW